MEEAFEEGAVGVLSVTCRKPAFKALSRPPIVGTDAEGRTEAEASGGSAQGLWREDAQEDEDVDAALSTTPDLQHAQPAGRDEEEEEEVEGEHAAEDKAALWQWMSRMLELHLEQSARLVAALSHALEDDVESRSQVHQDLQRQRLREIHQAMQRLAEVTEEEKRLKHKLRLLVQQQQLQAGEGIGAAAQRFWAPLQNPNSKAKVMHALPHPPEVSLGSSYSPRRPELELALRHVVQQLGLDPLQILAAQISPEAQAQTQQQQQQQQQQLALGQGQQLAMGQSQGQQQQLALGQGQGQQLAQSIRHSLGHGHHSVPAAPLLPQAVTQHMQPLQQAQPYQQPLHQALMHPTQPYQPCGHRSRSQPLPHRMHSRDQPHLTPFAQASAVVGSSETRGVGGVLALPPRDRVPQGQRSESGASSAGNDGEDEDACGSEAGTLLHADSAAADTEEERTTWSSERATSYDVVSVSEEGPAAAGAAPLAYRASGSSGGSGSSGRRRLPRAPQGGEAEGGRRAQALAQRTVSVGAIMTHQGQRRRYTEGQETLQFGPLASSPTAPSPGGSSTSPGGLQPKGIGHTGLFTRISDTATAHGRLPTLREGVAAYPSAADQPLMAAAASPGAAAAAGGYSGSSCTGSSSGGRSSSSSSGVPSSAGPSSGSNAGGAVGVSSLVRGSSDSGMLLGLGLGPSLPPLPPRPQLGTRRSCTPQLPAFLPSPSKPLPIPHQGQGFGAHAERASPTHLYAPSAPSAPSHCSPPTHHRAHPHLFTHQHTRRSPGSSERAHLSDIHPHTDVFVHPPAHVDFVHPQSEVFVHSPSRAEGVHPHMEVFVHPPAHVDAPRPHPLPHHHHTTAAPHHEPPPLPVMREGGREGRSSPEIASPEDLSPDSGRMDALADLALQLPSSRFNFCSNATERTASTPLTSHASLPSGTQLPPLSIATVLGGSGGSPRAVKSDCGNAQPRHAPWMPLPEGGKATGAPARGEGPGPGAPHREGVRLTLGADARGVALAAAAAGGRAGAGAGPGLGAGARVGAEPVARVRVGSEPSVIPVSAIDKAAALAARRHSHGTLAPGQQAGATAAARSGAERRPVSIHNNSVPERPGPGPGPGLGRAVAGRNDPVTGGVGTADLRDGGVTGTGVGEATSPTQAKEGSGSERGSAGECQRDTGSSKGKGAKEGGTHEPAESAASAFKKRMLAALSGRWAAR